MTTDPHERADSPGIDRSVAKPVLRVLFVCTANITRSMAAEHLARHQARQLGVDIGFSSAGMLPGDREADPPMAQLLDRRGIDTSAHRSRTATVPILASADVVLTMERNHVLFVADVLPDVLGRSFTLKDFVDRSPTSPDASLQPRLAELAGGRAPNQLFGSGTPDEVVDPHGRSRRHYRRALDEIDDLVARALDELVRA